MTPNDRLKEQSEQLNKGYKKTISSFKKLSKRHKLYASLSLVLALAIISALTGTGKLESANYVSGQRTAITAVKTMARLEDLGTVEKYEVPNSTKTVIFVPQIHKEPTKQASDSVNDSAAVIQADIYRTLNTLVNEHDITYVMDETDLYGPMPQDKIAKIKAGISDIDELRKSMNITLDQYVKVGGSQKVADDLRKSTEERIKQFERNLYLTGGAAVLAATNANSHVYGSQNAATISEARKELQNIVYLENRINTLQGKTKSSGNLPVNSQSQSQKILSSLRTSDRSSGSAHLNPVYELSAQKQDQSLKSATDEFKTKYNKLSSSKTFETGSNGANASSAPVDPYKNSTNLSQLKAEYDQKLAAFMKVAKDQRSQEVADNVVRQMEENGQNSAILVFGAQHKDQIVDALNKKGISVIVVTPPSEVKYLQSQTKTNSAIN